MVNLFTQMKNKNQHVAWIDKMYLMAVESDALHGFQVPWEEHDLLLATTSSSSWPHVSSLNLSGQRILLPPSESGSFHDTFFLVLSRKSKSESSWDPSDFKFIVLWTFWSRMQSPWFSVSTPEALGWDNLTSCQLCSILEKPMLPPTLQQSLIPESPGNPDVCWLYQLSRFIQLTSNESDSSTGEKEMILRFLWGFDKDTLYQKLVFEQTIIASQTRKNSIPN